MEFAERQAKSICLRVCVCVCVRARVLVGVLFFSECALFI